MKVCGIVLEELGEKGTDVTFKIEQSTRYAVSKAVSCL